MRALRSEVVSYYAGGPWYGYSGWDDYQARNGYCPRARHRKHGILWQ